MWQQLRGHQQQVDMFRRAIQSGRTAHAYLFVGPSGVGKKLFAKQLAQCLFCSQHADEKLEACGECSACRQMIAQTHPDFLFVSCPEGKRELPISLIAGSNENRGREGLCHDLSMRPMSANRRIALIDDAETMNEAAANSFLKTLEEPPPRSLIFLITSEIDRILPTIRSRCQTVRFSQLSDEDLKSLLLAHGEIDNEQLVDELVPFAEGSLTTAGQLLDPGLQQLRRTVETCLNSTPIDGLRAAASVSAVLDELGGDVPQQRQNLAWANRFLIDSLRRVIRNSQDWEACDRYAAMLDRCLETEFHLKQTMPVALCLESLFDDLGAHFPHAGRRMTFAE